jgi:Tol biopolymer transport system component
MVKERLSKGFQTILFSFLLFLPMGAAAQTVHFESDGRIVFNSNFGGNDDIYLLTRNRLTKLTDDPASDEWPVPDGKGDRIVFTSNRAGSYDIYFLDLKSRAVQRLTSDPRNEACPSWGPGDGEIYYDLEVKRNAWKTMALDIATGISRPLFPDQPFSGTALAFIDPSGNEIFFTGKIFLGWLVAKYNVPNRKYTELTKKGSCRPKVSPDGTKIAYVCHDDDGLGDVFIMNTDGSGKRNMTPGRPGFHDYFPCFSPSGDMIVFSSSPKEKGKNAYQLYTLDLRSGEIVEIFAADGNSRFPYWFQ